MALKFKLKSKDEVPAELVSLYVERDGAWLLDVDGAVEKAKWTRSWRTGSRGCAPIGRSNWEP